MRQPFIGNRMTTVNTKKSGHGWVDVRGLEGSMSKKEELELEILRQAEEMVQEALEHAERHVEWKYANQPRVTDADRHWTEEPRTKEQIFEDLFIDGLGDALNDYDGDLDRLKLACKAWRLSKKPRKKTNY